jgi:protease-4
MSEENTWERQALEHLLLENLKENKRARRWRTFWRILFSLIMVGIIILMFQASNAGKGTVLGKHTALITIDGVISPSSPANASDINASLKAAFENPESVGVILRIDSPGGSPVQAGIIHDEIIRLRKLYPNKLLHVVVEEICASGGYYIAVAGDKIYVDKASLVGSIGVIMQGFGLTGLMDKLGVESRTITAGENKAIMDPFKKESPQQRAKMQALLDEIHAQFIQVVKEGRGDRLKNDPDLFTGMVWNGARSIELGLTDAIGTVDSVARDVFNQPDLVDYTLRENIAERVAKKFGAAAGTSFGKTISEQTRVQ